MDNPWNCGPRLDGAGKNLEKKAGIGENACNIRVPDNGDSYKMGKLH
jgi:hypothetical protein